MPTPAELDAATAIKAHHAELHEGLRGRVDAVRAAARAGHPITTPRDEAVAFLEAEILPHARAEEGTLYRAADTGAAALLVAAMRAEHGDLTGRVARLGEASDAIEAVSGASAILALFASHLAKENERLLPALLDQPDIALDDLLAGMHELVG